MNFETISFNHGTHNERKQLMRSIPQGFSSTAGISKKLVTIFASHLDNFIMTPNLLPFTNFVKPGWQKLVHGVLHAGTSYLLKYLDSWPAWLRHQRFLLIPATVRWHSSAKPQTVYFREFIMTLNFRQSTWTQPSGQFLHDKPACHHDTKFVV